MKTSHHFENEVISLKKVVHNMLQDSYESALFQEYKSPDKFPILEIGTIKFVDAAALYKESFKNTDEHTYNYLTASQNALINLSREKMIDVAQLENVIKARLSDHNRITSIENIQHTLEPIYFTNKSVYLAHALLEPILDEYVSQLKLHVATTTANNVKEKVNGFISTLGSEKKKLMNTVPLLTILENETRAEKKVRNFFQEYSTFRNVFINEITPFRYISIANEINIDLLIKQTSHKAGYEAEMKKFTDFFEANPDLKIGYPTSPDNIKTYLKAQYPLIISNSHDKKTLLNKINDIREKSSNKDINMPISHTNSTI